MSALLTWRALDEAGEARTAVNRPVFLPQTQAFSGHKSSFGLAICHRQRYNSIEPAPEKEIPVEIENYNKTERMT